jgi:dTDP-4-dehydrorhamnose 3,5-epimerase-like enzyme
MLLSRQVPILSCHNTRKGENVDNYGKVIAKYLQPVNTEDTRGDTLEWKFKDGRQITIYKRKKGVEFGYHYHKGDDPSKNPEHLMIVAGEISATFVRPDGYAANASYQAGQTFTIYPGVVHKMTALEDTIIIEYRITHFDPQHPDTYSVPGN